MVVSTRLGNKRQLQASQHPSVDRKPQTRKQARKQARKSVPKSKLHLLSLPIKIRYAILRHLLLLDEPIEFKTNGSKTGVQLWSSDPVLPQRLWPAILSTCRELYHDGSKILYTNSIRCRISNTLYYPLILGPRWSGPGGGIPNLPAAVLDKISRVHMEIHVNGESFSDNFLRIRSWVKELALAIRQGVPNWTHISFDLANVDPGQPSMVDEAEYLLSPFFHMRNRSTVSITGALETIDPKLIELMTSNEPGIDLHRMVEALDEYVCHRVDSEGEIFDIGNTQDLFRLNLIYKIQDLVSDIKWLYMEEDVDNFYEQRSRIMLFVSLHEKLKQDLVCRYDPPGRQNIGSLDYFAHLVETAQSDDAAKSQGATRILERIVRNPLPLSQITSAAKKRFDSENSG